MQHPKDEEKYCEYCGKKLVRKKFKSKIEDFGVFKRRRYCDRVCYRKAQIKKDATSQKYRAAHASAKAIQYIVMEKTGVCEKCGATKNIDVHHIDGDWHNNNPKNLIILCRSCHSKLHHPKGKCYLCGKPVKGHGLCNMHYIRYKKYGNPLLYQGKIVGKYFTERKQ